MAKSMTKAQLVDENIQLRAECNRLEGLLAASVDAVLSAPKPVIQAPASLPGRLSEAERKARFAGYFKANPTARSVTNEQLLAFC